MSTTQKTRMYNHQRNTLMALGTVMVITSFLVPIRLKIKTTASSLRKMMKPKTQPPLARLTSTKTMTLTWM